MATKKRRTKRVAANWGDNAAEVYATAQRILDIRAWFENPSENNRSEILEARAAARSRFEKQLSVDPRLAAKEHDDWVKSPWRANGGKALRDERLAQAVLLIAGSFAQEGPSGVYADIALHTLRELGVEKTSRADLIKLAKNGAVVLVREEGGGFSNGGLQAAAIAIVSLATGIGEQTVKRAVSAFRKRSKPLTL